MTKLKNLWLSSCAVVVFSTTSLAFAHAPKNLKVISPEIGKGIDKSMKTLSKGLGVKCEACHVKGKWAEDDVTAKEETRKFLNQTIGQADAAKRQTALGELLKALKLEKAKNEAQIWESVATLKKKA